MKVKENHSTVWPQPCDSEMGDGIFIVIDTLELQLPLGCREGPALRLINQLHSFSGKMISEL